jgi:hypothetical protein
MWFMSSSHSLIVTMVAVVTGYVLCEVEAKGKEKAED